MGTARKNIKHLLNELVDQCGFPTNGKAVSVEKESGGVDGAEDLKMEMFSNRRWTDELDVDSGSVLPMETGDLKHGIEISEADQAEIDQNSEDSIEEERGSDHKFSADHIMEAEAEEVDGEIEGAVGDGPAQADSDHVKSQDNLID